MSEIESSLQYTPGRGPFKTICVDDDENGTIFVNLESVVYAQLLEDTGPTTKTVLLVIGNLSSRDIEVTATGEGGQELFDMFVKTSNIIARKSSFVVKGGSATW